MITLKAVCLFFSVRAGVMISLHGQLVKFSDKKAYLLVVFHPPNVNYCFATLGSHMGGQIQA